MITCNLIGGLGNKMFQIATTQSQCIDNDDDCIFEITDASNAHNYVDTYKDNILRNVKFGKSDATIGYPEPYFHYTEIPYKPNLHLIGYFQSEKYFQHNRQQILDLFSMDEKSKRLINEKYGNTLKNNTCSLHVRRGDYLGLTNHHPPCTLSYYNKAMEYLSRDTTYLVFSDDLPWCKEVFLGNNFIFIDDNTDYIDMWVMSLCKNNIIANSSFSWWGGWLNQNINKVVISPIKWFGLSIKHNTNDLIPTEWERV